MIFFGDLFRYKEDDYVFLASKDNTIHAARILNPNHSRQLVRLYEDKVKKNKHIDILQATSIYCYVVLQTEEVSDRLCHLHGTEREGIFDFITPLSVKLCKEDIRKIYDEIMKKPVSLELKKMVQDIEI